MKTMFRNWLAPLIPFAVFLALVAGVAACSGAANSIQQDQAQTGNQLSHYQLVQPVPYFDWSMDRNTLIQLYEIKNEAHQTWSYWHAIGTNEVPDANWCPSIGYPIPADTQLTNPDQVVGVPGPWTGYITGTVSQMEPNGVYSSTNTDGTWVMCLGPSGKVEPKYVEDKVTAVAHQIKVVDGKVVDVDLTPTVTVDMKGAPSTTPPPSAKP